MLNNPNHKHPVSYSTKWIGGGIGLFLYGLAVALIIALIVDMF